MIKYIQPPQQSIKCCLRYNQIKKLLKPGTTAFEDHVNAIRNLPVLGTQDKLPIEDGKKLTKNYTIEDGKKLSNNLSLKLLKENQLKYFEIYERLCKEQKAVFDNNQVQLAKLEP